MRSSLVALTASLCLAAGGAFAQGSHDEARQLGAHEHGHAALNIALDGAEIAMELIAPSADIVGFEHDAESEADRAALESAMRDLGAPLALFAPPPEAGCAVLEAAVERVEIGHEGEHGDEHEHEAEAEGGDHDEHADHDEHDEHEAEHSEIHAEYLLRCDAPESLRSLDLGFFDRFEHAERLSVTVVSATGQQRFEAARGDDSLDLSGAL